MFWCGGHNQCLLVIKLEDVSLMATYFIGGIMKRWLGRYSENPEWPQIKVDKGLSFVLLQRGCSHTPAGTEQVFNPADSSSWIPEWVFCKPPFLMGLFSFHNWEDFLEEPRGFAPIEATFKECWKFKASSEINHFDSVSSKVTFLLLIS